jgi:hypothetical protein
MSTKATSIRAIIDSIPSTGAIPNTSEDKTFSLEGYLEADRREVTLGAAAADQALTLIGDVSGLVIVSTNGEPFKIRLKAAERLIGPTMIFVCGFHDDGDAALAFSDAGSVLLTGNGTNQAELLAIQVKTTS